MRQNGILKTGFILSLVMLVASCGPSVKITGSWKNPDVTPTKDYSKVMVAALVSNEKTKRAMEDAFETELAERGISSTKGHDLFPEMFTNRFDDDRERMLEEIQSTDNDAILSVSFLDEETETRYVPGAAAGPYRPIPEYRWYGSFGRYYSYTYPIVYEPGYYAVTEVYYIEANLYDAKSEELVWSGQTRTYDPVQIGEFASKFADAIVEELIEKELLAVPATAD